MVAPFVPKVHREEIKGVMWNGWKWTSYVKYQKQRSGYVQKAPYVNTAMEVVVLRCIAGEADCSSYGNAIGKHPLRQEAINSAYGKFIGKLGESSQFGSTVTAERKATWGTVVSGITTALRAARAVSKGKLGKAAKILGVAPPRHVVSVPVKRHKRSKKGAGSTKRIYRDRSVIRLPNGKEVAKSVGNNWLWYSYGVKPLVQDIYNGMDILQRPLPATKVVANSKIESRYKDSGVTILRSYQVRISANVRVNNPNLWLANQMGLINPIQMVNEGIPFSFILDWFSNLSQVINSMTDFVGLSIADPVTINKSYEMSAYAGPPPYALSRENLTRSLVVPSPKLRFAYERFSWQRGANAASLLVQVLKTAR